MPPHTRLEPVDRSFLDVCDPVAVTTPVWVIALPLLWLADGCRYRGGLMFWFMWKKFSGSYVALICCNRA